MRARWIPCLCFLSLVLPLAPAAAQDRGFTPDWTVGDWWEVEYHDVEPFCPAAHVCPPDGHPRVRTFLFVVMDWDEKEIEVKVVGGRDLAATAYLLATFRASDRSLARLRAVGWGEFDCLFMPGRPIPDPMAGVAADADYPALLFVLPVFPLAPPPLPPGGADLDRLVAKLGSVSWAEREEAAKALEAFGPGIAEALARLREHDDAEVRYRIARLLDKLLPDPANESYQKVEKTAEGAFRVELASGRKLVWLPDAPWYESLEVDPAGAPGVFPGGGGRPSPSVLLVAKKGDPGVEPPAIEDAAAAEAYGAIRAAWRDSGLDRPIDPDEALAFVRKFPESPYAVKVVLMDESEGWDDPRWIDVLEDRSRAGLGTPGELAEVEFRLGYGLREAGDSKKAREAYGRALGWLDRFPDNTGVKHAAGWALDHLAALDEESDPDSALRYLARLAEIGSPEKRVEAGSRQAGIHGAAGRHAEAEAALRESLGECIVEGATEDLRFRLGEALAAQGKNDEAREVWRSIRTVGDEWRAKAREKLAGSPVEPGFRVIESWYSRAYRSRGSVAGEVVGIRADGDGIVAYLLGSMGGEWRSVSGPIRIETVVGRPIRYQWFFGFESPLVVGDYEIRAPERFNLGAALLGDGNADMDGDGSAERILTVLLGGWVEEKGHPEFYGGEIHVLGTDGKRLWKVETDEPAEGAFPVDLDGDGKSEVVVGTRGDDGKGAIVAFSASGEVLWRHETDRGARSILRIGGPDGRPRLVALTDSKVEVLDATGVPLWSDDLSEPVAAVADLDGDGREEIAIGGDRIWLEVRDADGKILHRVEGFTKIRALFPVSGPDGTRRLLVGASGLHLVGHEK